MQYGEKSQAWLDAERAASDAQKSLFEHLCADSLAVATPAEIAHVNELRRRASALIHELLRNMQTAAAAIPASRRP